jgi:hypothetical protein
MLECHGLIFFLVICEGGVMALISSWLYVSHDPLTYNQEENKAMTPSHITRKKIKP